MSTNAARKKAVLLALGIFALGAALGATYQHWLPSVTGQRISDRTERRRVPRLGGASERLLNRYARNLELSDEQRGEIEEILDESRLTIGNVRREIRDRTESVTRKTRARIRNVLTPDQQERFDELTSPVSPAIILRQLTRDLDLDDGQQATAKTILEKNWASMQKLRKKVREQLKARQDDARDELYGVLSPQQLEQIDGRRPAAYRGLYRRPDLNLSDEQRAQLERIEKESRGATRRVFQERDEQLASAIGKTWWEIRTLLREEQVGKFEEITSGIERRMRWERQFRRRPGGRPFDF